MINDIAFKIIKSITITLAVSTTFSLFLFSIGYNFLYSFLFFTLLQFIGFYFYGEYVKRKTSRLLLDLEIKQTEIKSKQQATVVCPCDRNVETTIPININGDNTYKCPGCMKNISVYITTKTALTTTPTNTIEV
jgi:hypothetical protein